MRGDEGRPVVPEFEVQHLPAAEQEAVMALNYTDPDDIVDPLRDFFDAEAWTTKQLEAEQKKLKADIRNLDDLINGLIDRLGEMRDRAGEVEDELEARAEVSEEAAS
jgi:hypothetical protein